MNDHSSLPPARLYTTFGTVVYADPETGELRHGPIETSPANVLLEAIAQTPGTYRLGRWRLEPDDSRAPVIVTGDAGNQRFVVRRGATAQAGVEIIPLERGLIGLKCQGLFVSAEPGGVINGSRPWCSTWESFLASEDWCAADGRIAGDKIESAISNKQIAAFLIDPRLRARVNAKSTVTKVLIYGYPRWSHGRVYYDLCKLLHRKGYIVDILNWQGDHAGYFHELAAFYDLIMTAPDGVATLVDKYAVPYEKIIAVSHHEMDIRMLIEQKGKDVFDRFAAFAAVSHSVYCASMMQGVTRPPMVAALGVNFDEFYMCPSERLEAVGYASSMSVITYGVEWKRGYLAEAATREAGLTFKVAGSTENQISFHDMPDFYRSVDAVLMASVSESGPLTVMEAAAAGRLVIGTPVGHFPLKAYQGGGIIAPVEAKKFQTFAAAVLQYYKERPSEYVAKCRSIQEAARQFDWNYSIKDWKDLIEGAKVGVSGVPNWKTQIEKLAQ